MKGQETAQLPPLPMNLSLPSRQRVHWVRDGAPACGGGRHGKRGEWQAEFAEVTCRRCVQIALAAAQPKGAAK